MSKWAPDSREADSWFSDEQLAKVTPADEVVDDDFRSPVPTQMVSNGEYMPEPQTQQQKHVEHRIKELADEAAKKLGISRRSFLSQSGGMAASFIAMNEVYGKLFDVSREEMFEPEAYATNGPPRDLFVLDDQLHIVRSSRGGPGSALRDIAAGRHTTNNPTDLPDELGIVNQAWNPKMKDDPNWRSSWHLPNFIKWVYLDSQVTVGVLTNNNSAALPDPVTGGTRPPKNVAESEAAEQLTAAQTMAARNFINRVSGSKRALGHGQLYVGKGNLDFMEYQIRELKPDTWKGYNIATAAKVDFDPDSDMRRWRLDDENVAFPTYDLIRKFATKEKMKQVPGFKTLCVHKGLSTTAGREPELGHPMDIPKAARLYPDFNFVIYHACIRPGFWVANALADIGSKRLRNGPAEFDIGSGLRDGVPDILWSTEFAYIARPFRNVYAEIGTTFASCIITFPTVAAHLFGQFMKIMGDDRIVFGSDSVHYGAPQWQIDALWRFQIPERIREKWAYPELTKEAKKKILGLNSARIYKLPTGVDDDEYERGFGGRDDEGEQRDVLYMPVPRDYQLRLDAETKRIMEFPSTWVPCNIDSDTAADSCSRNQFSQDNFAKMRKMYAEAGGRPANIRRGWLRTRL